MVESIPEGTQSTSRIERWGLPEPLLAELVSDNLVVRYSKNARLFLQGTPCDMLMLVVSGAVKIYCPYASGRNFMLRLAGPSDVISYADFIDAKGRCCVAFEAQALTNCSVALIGRQRIERELAKLAPDALVDLLRRLNTFWSSTVYRCAALMSMTYRERLELVVSEVAENFGIKDAHGVLLTLELGHDEWAELIASSRSLVSKLISQMIDEGILERDGKRYTLLDSELLQRKRNSLINLHSQHTHGGSAGHGRQSLN